MQTKTTTEKQLIERLATARTKLQNMIQSGSPFTGLQQDRVEKLKAQLAEQIR